MYTYVHVCVGHTNINSCSISSGSRARSAIQPARVQHGWYGNTRVRATTPDEMSFRHLLPGHSASIASPCSRAGAKNRRSPPPHHPDRLSRRFEPVLRQCNVKDVDNVRNESGNEFEVFPVLSEGRDVVENPGSSYIK